MQKESKINQIRMPVLIILAMVFVILFPTSVKASSIIGIVSIKGNTVTYYDDIDDEF